MRLNLAEENSDSQAWVYICILAICIECLQRTIEWNLFLFLLVFKWRVCFVTYLQNDFNYPFFCLPLFRPAFSPTSLLEPCFTPCLLSWPACFLFPALAPSITWPLSLASQLPVSLVLLSVLCPLPFLLQSPKQGTVQVFKHRCHCSWPLTSGFCWVMCCSYPWSRFQQLFICFLQAFVPELFCWSDHSISIYSQNPCTVFYKFHTHRSVWNWFIFVLRFMTWLVWALSCGLHLQPPPSSWKLCRVYLPGAVVLLIMKQDSCLLVASI